jgi:hypothetical protein
MADKIPVKAIYTGSDVTSLGEYTSTDKIASTYLNTGTGSTDISAGNHTHSGVYEPVITSNAVTNTAQAFTEDQTFEALTETVTAKSAAFTPDLTNDGTIFSVTGAVAVTMPTVENGKSFTIVASAPVSSWAGATIKWPSATVPTGTGIVIYTFVASGSQWYGFEAGNAFA